MRMFSTTSALGVIALAVAFMPGRIFANEIKCSDFEKQHKDEKDCKKEDKGDRKDKDDKKDHDKDKKDKDCKKDDKGKGDDKKDKDCKKDDDRKDKDSDKDCKKDRIECNERSLGCDNGHKDQSDCMKRTLCLTRTDCKKVDHCYEDICRERHEGCKTPPPICTPPPVCNHPPVCTPPPPPPCHNPPPSVPEPTSLFAIGLLAVGALRRRLS